jgi:hypothetical protein
MTSMVLGDSTLKSLTPSVNAPLLSKCGYFFLKEESWKSAQIFSPQKNDDFIGLQREMWQILWNLFFFNPLDHVDRP